MASNNLWRDFTRQVLTTVLRSRGRSPSDFRQPSTSFDDQPRYASQRTTDVSGKPVEIELRRTLHGSQLAPQDLMCVIANAMSEISGENQRDFNISEIPNIFKIPFRLIQHLTDLFVLQAFLNSNVKVLKFESG